MAIKFKLQELKSLPNIKHHIRCSYGIYFCNKYQFVITMINNEQHYDMFFFHQLQNFFPDIITTIPVEQNTQDSVCTLMYNAYNTKFFYNSDAVKSARYILSSKLENEYSIQQHKIMDLCENPTFILNCNLLSIYNIYLCYWNDKYLMLTDKNEIPKPLLSIEAKDVLELLQ